MFLFTNGSGGTCFVGFIGVVWIVMIVGAIVRAVGRNRFKDEIDENGRICPNEKCESHNSSYARFCRRCGATLGKSARLGHGSGLNEDSR